MPIVALDTNISAAETERLWTTDDGTTCVLATMTSAPRYTLSLRKGSEVIRQRRLFGLATARMLAQGWRDVGSYAERG